MHLVDERVVGVPGPGMNGQEGILMQKDMPPVTFISEL